MDNKTEKYLALIEKLEKDRESDERALREICRELDVILRDKDFELLEKAAEKMMRGQKELVVRHSELVRFQDLMSQLSLEKNFGGPLFISDTDSFGELMIKYEKVNLYLRRIELDIEPGLEEAYAYIREQSVSPFAVAGIVYNTTSFIGHKESVLMKLADRALEQGDVLRSYAFLAVIREPSEEMVLLKNELKQVLESMNQNVRK